MFKKLSSIWQSYKYRFVPWIALNLKKRSVRSVENVASDKVIPGDLVLQQLTCLTSALRFALPRARALEEKHQLGLRVMEEVQGFSVVRAASHVGGTGVVVQGKAEARVQRGQVVALYPGLLYLPFQPIFLQSVGNSFVFRCIDGVHVDGNDRRMSRAAFRSCVGRDRVGHLTLADTSWLTPHPVNPLNVGQYVNNRTAGRPSNVAYQEVTVRPGEVALEDRHLLPNLWYSPPADVPVADLPLRLVALVATRDVAPGEELFSDYFTVVH